MHARSQVTNEIAATWEAFQSDRRNLALRNRLVEHYYPVVKTQAHYVWRRLPNTIGFDDLVSVGVFGLMQAIDSFDCNRGIPFDRYCVRRVRGAMADELRRIDWVPRKLRDRITKANKAIDILRGKLGRQPSEEELAHLLNVPQDEVAEIVRAMATGSLSSLHEARAGYDEARLADVVECREADHPEKRSRGKEFLRLACKGLNRRERLVVILYYFEGLTMKQISEQMGVVETRICQIHAGVIKRLRARLSELRE